MDSRSLIQYYLIYVSYILYVYPILKKLTELLEIREAVKNPWNIIIFMK